MLNLTQKEKEFTKHYVANGFNGAGAYRIAFQTTNNKVAQANACRLLKKDKIQQALDSEEFGYRRIGRKIGLDRDAVMAELAGIIKGKESKTKDKLGAITILCKLTGCFSAHKQEISINEGESALEVDVSKLSEIELIELQQELLASL